MNINMQKVLILLIIATTLVSTMYFLTIKKLRERGFSNFYILQNTSNFTVVDILKDRLIRIETERPLETIKSSYYNTTFSWERKFVKFGNLTLLDVEVYYFENSSERSRVISKFVEEDKGETFVGIEKTVINDWEGTCFDFRSLIDGKIVGWGCILEKDKKAIYFISTHTMKKAEREEVVRWVIGRF